jgi:hypothetical protein
MSTGVDDLSWLEEIFTANPPPQEAVKAKPWDRGPQEPLPKILEDRLLSEAQEEVRDHLAKGNACPCCGQHAKMYKRLLSSTMARGLIWLVGEATPDRNWVNVSEDGPRWLVKVGGTLATLAHWGLIEDKPNKDTTKRTSGIWRPTKEGVEFAFGHSEVPSHCVLYNNSPIDWVARRADIIKALGKKFDYQEMMSDEYLWEDPDED